MFENLFSFILGFGAVVGLSGAIVPSGRASASLFVFLFIIATLAAFGFTNEPHRFGYIHLALIRMTVLAILENYYALVFGAVSGIVFSLYLEGTLGDWMKKVSRQAN